MFVLALSTLLTVQARVTVSPTLAYVRSIKDETAEQDYSLLFRKFSDESVSRRALLNAFKLYAAKFPHEGQASECRQVVSILQTMVAEDIAHASKRNSQHPSSHERIAELIWQLRNVNSNSFLQYVGPRSELAQIGMAAVPQLIGALRDQRFTRSIKIRMSGQPTLETADTVVRVSDLAETLLEYISRRTLRGIDWRDRPILEQNAKKWYATVSAKRDVVTNYQQGARIVTVTDPLPAKVDREFLLRVISEDKAQARRIAAIKALAVHDPDLTINMMENEWSRSPGFENEWQVSDSMIGFLLESARPDAVKFIQSNLRSHDTTQRESVLSFYGRGFDQQWPEEFPKVLTHPLDSAKTKEYQAAVEDLLASQLQDSDRWIGGIGTGDVSFGDGTMNELACHALWKCFPKVYSFRKTVSPREQARFAATSLNVYRGRRGLQPLPLPPAVVVHPAPEVVVSPLVARIVAGPDRVAANRIADLGLHALPAVMKASKGTASAMARHRLIELARPISCTLRRVEVVDAQDAGETEIGNQIRSNEGRVLTTESFFKLIKLIAKGVRDGHVRPATVLLERDADFAGFTMTVKYVAVSKHGAASMLLNNERIRIRSGGGLDTYLGTIDEYLVGGVHRCLASPPDAVVSIALSIGE